MALRKDLYVSISGVTGIENINISESYGQTSAVATIVCTDTSLSLNSPISIDLGYTDAHNNVFTGRVKAISRSREEGTIKLTCRDTLVDAADRFMVADDPEHPWERNNIKAEDLVGDLLAEASISAYSHSVPLSFTYAIHAPIQFNFTSVIDAIGQICSTLVWHVWADNGTVYFSDIKPYYRSGNDKDTEYGQSGNTDDVVSHTLRTTNVSVSGPTTAKPIIKQIDYTFSDEELRNEVDVFGREGITATAQVASPYLPENFYKAAVIATPLIDSSEMAAQTASFNLIRYNRLTESCQLECLGDSTIKARQFADINDSSIGVSGYWFIETVNHTFTNGGFTTRLSVRK